MRTTIASPLLMFQMWYGTSVKHPAPAVCWYERVGASGAIGEVKPFLGVDVKSGQRPARNLHFKHFPAYETYQCTASIDVSDVTRHKC